MLVSRAVKIYDRLDILVNNSSVGLLSPFESLGDDIMNKQVSADIKSIVYCSQESTPYMRGQVILLIFHR
jgi:NAD(P)-dependent dehydrogenase (short-subunit alcohol dehydrogenase family)